MRDFILATDSDTEIPYQYADEHQIPVFLMPYTVNGEEKLFDLGRNTDFIAFYEQLAGEPKPSPPRGRQPILLIFSVTWLRKAKMCSICPFLRL